MLHYDGIPSRDDIMNFRKQYQRGVNSRREQMICPGCTNVGDEVEDTDAEGDHCGRSAEDYIVPV